MVVDVVSSLGAVPFAFDDWGIDVAVGGSQKALSASPGIAFVAVSDRARAAAETRDAAALLLRLARVPHVRRAAGPREPVDAGDQRACRASARRSSCTSRTASTPRCARHETLSRAVKDGVRAIGLDLFGEGLDDNWTVTAIRAPEGISADTICDTIRADFGCVLAPGQGPLKGTVFRIGHFGYVSELDIIRGLAALEMTLERLGYPVKRGAAVAAAEQVFQEAG